MSVSLYEWRRGGEGVQRIKKDGGLGVKNKWGLYRGKNLIQVRMADGKKAEQKRSNWDTVD